MERRKIRNEEDFETLLNEVADREKEIDEAEKGKDYGAQWVMAQDMLDSQEIAVSEICEKYGVQEESFIEWFNERYAEQI